MDNKFIPYKNNYRKNIKINIIYDHYIDLGDKKYAPSRLRAIISGLDQNFIENNDRIGYKDFEIGRDNLATKIEKSSSRADTILLEGKKIFNESKNFLPKDNTALLELKKEIDIFLESIK